MHSTPPTGIKGALPGIGGFGYLASLVKNYISGRTFWYGKGGDPKEYVVRTSIPQGSALGSLRKMVMYSGALTFSVQEEDTIISFADDLAVVFIAKYPEDAEVIATETVRPGLTFRIRKQKRSLIMNRRKKNIVKVEVSAYMVIVKMATKYLGVMIDTKLSFRDHLLYTYQKADSVIGD